MNKVLNILILIFFSFLFVKLDVLYLLKDELGVGVVYSLTRLFVGVFIALMLSYCFSLFCLFHPIVERIVRFIFSVLYPVPKLALFPLLMILVGIGDNSQIALISFGSFFLILSSLLDAVEDLKRQKIFFICEVYRLSWFVFLRQIYFKGTLLSMLQGLKLGLGYGLVMVVAGEMYGATNGLGHFIWNSWDAYRLNDLYAGIFFISFLGFIFHNMIDFLKCQLSKRKY